MLRYLTVALALLFMRAPYGTAQEDSASVRDLASIEERMQGIDESLTEVRNIVDALRKIKISGYLQAQYRYTDLINQQYPIGSFSGGQFPSNTKNLFQVRRGRLKFNYDNTLSQFVIQIDAIHTGLSLKDAYASLVEPWTQSFGLQMGVFDRPFGYEISYSSGSRESPERSRVFQTLFPGERELGAKLFYAPPIGPLSILRADVGLFNGSGPTANDFDNFKDVIGHVAVQLPLGEESPLALDLGASGYLGNVRSNSKDVFHHGQPAAGVNGFVKTTDTTNFGRGISRSYLGADLQLYYDVPLIGGLILRGEFISGHQPGTSSSTVSPSSQPTTPLYKRKFTGWYVNLVQNIGDKDQLVLKYDLYDPNRKASAADFTPASGLTVADIKYSTLGIGFIHHWDATVKLVLYYEMVRNEELDPAKIPPTSSLFPYTKDVRDNVFTFRIQYRF